MKRKFVRWQKQKKKQTWWLGLCSSCVLTKLLLSFGFFCLLFVCCQKSMGEFSFPFLCSFFGTKITKKNQQNLVIDSHFWRSQDFETANSKFLKIRGQFLTTKVLLTFTQENNSVTQTQNTNTTKANRHQKKIPILTFFGQKEFVWAWAMFVFLHFRSFILKTIIVEVLRIKFDCSPTLSNWNILQNYSRPKHVCWSPKQQRQQKHWSFRKLDEWWDDVPVQQKQDFHAIRKYEGKNNSKVDFSWICWGV